MIRRPPRSTLFPYTTLFRSPAAGRAPHSRNSRGNFMKLLRFGPEGQEKPGLLDAEGQIRDLSALLDDYTPRLLGRKALRALAAIDPARLPLVQGPVRIGMPWSGIDRKSVV